MGFARALWLPAFILGSVAAASAQQAPGQVGYWPLDETASPGGDFSGSGNPGTWQGGPTPDATNRPVPPNSFADPRSLGLDGTDDWVDIGNPAGLPAGTSARSCAGWGRPTTVGGTWGWLFAYGSAGTGQAMFLGRNGATLYGGGYGDDLTVANFWQANVWAHVALTYDGTTARLYANGAEVAMAAKNWNLVPNRVRIGRQVNDAAEFWVGQVDDVRLWNRALTPTEVAILAGGLPAPGGLNAVAGISEITLTWTAPPNAPAQTQAYPYQYRVKRSNTPGTGYVTIATVSTLTYLDTPLTPLQPYYYIVTAVSAGESGPALEDSATPTAPTPRTNSHEEGLFGDRCACGSSMPPLPAWPAFAAGLLLLAASRRGRRA